MTILPDTSQSGGNPNDQPQAPTDSGQASGPITTGNKEIEGNIEMGELPLRPTSPEVNLPKEVASAGVSAYPTTVSIPPTVAQMGVMATGANVPTAAATVVLPLTDDQIALSLKKSVKVSIRWLAEWCVRKIKQLHHSLLKK